MKDKGKVGGTAWTLWRVRKTIFQMCHDRGYMVIEKELQETLEEFLSKFSGERDFNDQLTILLEHQFDPNNQITVFYPKSPEIGRGDVFHFSKSMHEKNISKAIIVVDKSITPSALQFIQVLAPRMFIEVFYENELLVNITEHKCVPDHFLLTPEEKQQLLEKYSVREHQLKGILVTDPVSRYYGAKRGQVFRIVRPSETGGRYVEYRVVIYFEHHLKLIKLYNDKFDFAYKDSSVVPLNHRSITCLLIHTKPLKERLARKFFYDRLKQVQIV